MKARLFAIVCLALAGLPAVAVSASAETMKVLETGPADRAVVEALDEGFFVRFDKPVDHIRSLLFVKRDGQIVETLHPRFKSTPEVLFARAPALQAGDYTLHWSVRNMDGSEIVEGEISFTVRARPPGANSGGTR